MKQEEKLEEAKRLYQTANADQRYVLESLFPELAESEDERIRKAIINTIEDCSPILSPEVQKRMIAWLEKQGEQKSIFDFNANNWYVSKVDGKIHNIYNSGLEPKFHKDEWVVNNATLNLCHILRVEHGQYICDDCSFPITKENEYHLWTIQDAKDGDVLAFDDETIVIFKDLYNSTTFHSYCHIEDNVFYLSKDEMPDWWEGKGFHPATKEQRDLLFQKMKEAGYTFDSEKKELKKISQRMISAEAKEALYDKPAWSEEDEMNLKRLILYLSCREKIISEVKSRYINWLKSLKGRVQPQPKKEWSEEDEHRAKDTIYFLDTAKKHYASTVELNACIDWLKSIKQKLL